MNNEPTNVGKLSMIKSGKRLNIKPHLWKGNGHHYTFPQMSELLGIHRIIWTFGSCIITDYEKKVRFKITVLDNEHQEKRVNGWRWSIEKEVIN